MRLSYDRSTLMSYTGENVPVYLLGNGLGGFSSQSIWGMHLRKHQGLLVGALNPPADRHVLLWDIQFFVGGEPWIHFPKKEDMPKAPNNLKHFVFDGTAHFLFEKNGFVIDQRIVMPYREHEVHVRYTIQNTTQSTQTVSFHPLIALRPAGGVNEKNKSIQISENDDGSWNIRNESCFFRFNSDGISLKRNERNDVGPFLYLYDEAMGDERDDYVISGLKATVDIPADTIREITFHATMAEQPRYSFAEAININKRRMNNLIEPFRDKDSFFRELVMAGDPFVVLRQSTNHMSIVAGYPWFADWGRDAMIAFEGLLLKTRRYSDASSVLRGFAKHEKNGLIPNMFPEHGEPPLYNTVDASLWFIMALYAYHKHTDDIDTLEALFPTVDDIISHYESGTDHHIKMDDDGLITAGDEHTQLTWMDVRFDNHSVTPRHGKAVEINAYWYNALSMSAKMAKIVGRPREHYLNLAEKAKESFLKTFWNEEKQCLYDTAEPYDDHIRPNMLYAAGLPFTPIHKKYMQKIVDVARDHLVGMKGVLSLSRCDGEFKETYGGSLKNRDLAYHMGTAWGYLIGIYIDACFQAYGKKGLAMAKPLMERIKHGFREGCINGYGEVFDGKDGWSSKGCFTQAWSVAEILRVYDQYDWDDE